MTLCPHPLLLISRRCLRRHLWPLRQSEPPRLIGTLLCPPLTVPVTYEYTSLKTPNEAEGFWGVLARKAKAILDDDDDDHVSENFGMPNRSDPPLAYNSSYSTAGQFYYPHQSPESSRKVDNPTLRKGLDALKSSLNQIGDTIGNALEEGRSVVENRTADIIQETRKLQIRRKGTNSVERIHASSVHNPWREPPVFSSQPQIESNQEIQLKASRDVRWQWQQLPRQNYFF